MPDDAAFEDMFREHFEFSRAVARRILRDPGEVDDAVQEAWIRLYGAIDRYDLSGGVKGLIARFTTNEALRIAGRHSRRPGTAGDVPLSVLGDPLVPPGGEVDPALMMVEKDECRAALHKVRRMRLSRIQRKVLFGLLRGRTPQELGEELDITPAYIYVIKHRVLKMT